MESFLVPAISVIISIVVESLIIVVIFANKFGKIQEKLKVVDDHKLELDALDRRVTKFHVEIGKIKTTLDNLDKEMSKMRIENNMQLRELREETRSADKDIRADIKDLREEMKSDNKDMIKQFSTTLDRLADKIDKHLPLKSK
jgi:predicted  nucleic acid-binding Zn-ribbon protein